LTRPNTLLHTHTQTEQCTHRQTDIHRQTDTQIVQVLTHFTGAHKIDTDKDNAIHKDRQSNVHTDRQTGRQTDMHRHTDSTGTDALHWTDRYTDTQTCKHTTDRQTESDKTELTDPLVHEPRLEN